MNGTRYKTFLKWFGRPGTLIALSAVIISVVSVVVSVFEARVMRDWQRASVWPYVELYRSFGPNSKGEIVLSLNAKNVGVGPAKIQDFVVTVDGVHYSDWGAAFSALDRKWSVIKYGQSTINHTVLSAGSTVRIFEYNSRQTDIAEIQSLLNGMARLDFAACYCSVFGDCWQNSYRNLDVRELGRDKCKSNEESFQE